MSASPSFPPPHELFFPAQKLNSWLSRRRPMRGEKKPSSLRVASFFSPLPTHSTAAVHSPPTTQSRSQTVKSNHSVNLSQEYNHRDDPGGQNQVPGGGGSSAVVVAAASVLRAGEGGEEGEAEKSRASRAKGKKRKISNSLSTRWPAA